MNASTQRFFEDPASGTHFVQDEKYQYLNKMDKMRTIKTYFVNFSDTYPFGSGSL